MKKLVILILLILLPGCDAPVTVDERSNQLRHDYDTLLVERDNLLIENERLENISANLTDLRNEHNKLINNYHTLQTQYAILEAYFNSLRDQYNSLVEQFSSRYVDSGDIITELYKQNFNLIERQSELNEQIGAVHKGNVPILSDNLTESEYSAFYKGWGLWWGEFND